MKALLFSSKIFLEVTQIFTEKTVSNIEQFKPVPLSTKVMNECIDN